MNIKTATIRRTLTALVLGLLASLTIALPAHADTTPAACGTNDPACPTRLPDCTDPALSKDPICGRVAELTTELVKADQTANDYRQQVVALTAANEALQARADRLQRKADRQAATIQRLRAVIRGLR